MLHVLTLQRNVYQFSLRCTLSRIFLILSRTRTSDYFDMGKQEYEMDPAEGVNHLEMSETDIPEVKGVSCDNETARYAGAPIEIDKKTNKRLFWMVNRRILFIMLGTYFCQSLDKGTLNFASIMGIKDDARLKGQEVSLTQTPQTVVQLFWAFVAPVLAYAFNLYPMLIMTSIAGLAPFCTWVSLLVNFHKISCYRNYLSPNFSLRSKYEAFLHGGQDPALTSTASHVGVQWWHAQQRHTSSPLS
jgi:hypothetical protein